MDTSFCIEALEEAIERYGCHEIFSTDQGSQFTSEEFTQVLTCIIHRGSVQVHFPEPQLVQLCN